MAKTKKRKVGHPSKFPSFNLQDVKKYVCAGLTDEQLSVVLHIDKQTLNNYKKVYPEFFDSLKGWKLQADKRVERSLYERACGYSHPAVKFFQHGKKIIKQEYIEHHPPDPTSMIFWLKNRQPKNWRDRHEIETPLATIHVFVQNILTKAGLNGQPERKTDTSHSEIKNRLN